MNELLLCVGLGGVLAGLIIGKWMEAAHWRGKSDDSQGSRTAICSGGKFFYVLPNDEYVEKVLKLHRVNGQWRMPEELETLKARYSDQHPYGVP